MQINTLKLKKAKRRRKTVGRGGKKGTYSGRGNKGQKARSGASINPLFEGGRSSLIDRLKKTRGFKSLAKKPLILDAAKLAKKFKEGDIINKEALVKAKLLKKKEFFREVKVLNMGALKHRLTFEKGIKITQSGSKKKK